MPIILFDKGPSPAAKGLYFIMKDWQPHLIRFQPSIEMTSRFPEVVGTLHSVQYRKTKVCFRKLSRIRSGSRNKIFQQQLAFAEIVSDNRPMKQRVLIPAQEHVKMIRRLPLFAVPLPTNILLRHESSCLPEAASWQYEAARDLDQFVL
jgi:hypothetical protein